MSALPRLARNFTSLTGTTLVARFANALLTIAAARQLGVDDYGLYATSLTIIFVAVTLTSFGTGRVITRDVAQNKSLANHYLTSSILISFALALASMVLLPLLAPVLGYEAELRNLLLIIGLAVAGQALARPAESVLKAFERIVIFSAVRFVVMITMMGFGLWLIYAGYGVLELLWLQVASAWLEAILLLLALNYRVNRLHWRPSREMAARIIQLGSPLLAMIAISLVRERADILLLARLSGTEAVGFYSPAVSVIRYITIVRASVIAVVFPYLSIKWQDSERSFLAGQVSTIRLLLIYGIGAAVAITMMADVIIELIFTTEYTASANVLRILVWAMVFDLVAIPLGTAIVIQRDRLVRFLPFASIVAAANVALNLLLIPAFDFMGSAWAALFTAALGLLINYWWVGRVEGLERPPLARILWRPVVAGVGAGLVFLLLREFNLWLVAIPAAAVYVGILLALGAFQPREIDYLRQVIARRTGFLRK